MFLICPSAQSIELIESTLTVRAIYSTECKTKVNYPKEYFSDICVRPKDGQKSHLSHRRDLPVA
jgi:hypothetical protein